MPFSIEFEASSNASFCEYSFNDSKLGAVSRGTISSIAPVLVIQRQSGVPRLIRQHKLIILSSIADSVVPILQASK